MSLKQECEDMIRLIMESAKTEGYHFYELEVDTVRDICELTGEDITDCGCDNCDYCENCDYKKCLKVDVSFWDGGDCQRNFVFGKKKNLHNGICYINNQKQLMDEMFKLKNTIEEFKNYYASFGQQYGEFMKYAKEFGEKLKEEHFFFKNLSTDILPIVFHSDFRKDNDSDIRYDVGGDLNYAQKQAVINLYDFMYDVEETRQRLRHELIHYFLYMNDMKHGDDTAIFHYLCELYDARAYKEMGHEEQMVYDRLITSIGKLKKISMTQKAIRDDFQSSCDVMLFAIGKTDATPFGEDVFENGKQLLNMMDLYNEVA